jgi:HEAT repeat protein
VLLLLACGNGSAGSAQQPNPEYQRLRGSDVNRAQQLYRDGKKKEGADLLRQLATDDNWEVRSNAVRTIGQVRDQDLLPEVHALLADPQMEVRESAGRVLTLMANSSSREALHKALSDPSGAVRARAAEALITLAEVKDLPLLAPLLEKDEDTDVRALLAMSLGGFRDPAVVPLLVGALDDESAIVRGEAVGALGAVGDPSGRPALEKAASSDPDTSVRDRAAAALAQLQVSGQPAKTP